MIEGAIQNKRIEWIDMARGIGMLCVMAGHLNLSYLGRWMYSFHIPLFFFLSGYCHKGGKNFKLYINQKIRKLLIPYIFFGTVIVLFDLVVYQGENFSDNIIGFLLQIRWTTLWYIFVLFWVDIFLFVLLQYFDSKIIFCFSILGVVIGFMYYRLGGISLPWNLDITLMAFIFYVSGYFCKEKRLVESIQNGGGVNKKVLMTFCFGINMLGFCINWFLFHSGLNMFGNSYANPVITYISAFSGIMGVVIFSDMMIVRQVAYVGRNTMVYFTLHQSIAYQIILKSLQKYDLLQGDDFVDKLALKLITFTFSLLILTIMNEAFLHTKGKFLIGK